ncbi:homeobox-leucine zipper protein HDG11-like isoform X2 [Benincasa hispida]|uniref:homeobox-leucine zipper protein HDG11-like isoform X2 n=1 Tax=Benincasa hispida TaxID=102211 RepID=UPI001900DC72|nr:homeobox-leucine zipper protein HDG11-like isoform X2 [Benincasa hispida]
MDFVTDGRGGYGGGSADDQEGSNDRKGKKTYHRHNPYQIQQLESFFRACPHPDENQRRQLSRELGLETKQIKFWFQNKRTQTKAQNERADNSSLRTENEKIQCENLAIREALRNVICPSCGGPPFGEEERQRNLQKLRLENSHLKEEHEKVSNLLAKYIGKPISQLESLLPVLGSSLDLSPRSSLTQIGASPAVDLISDPIILDGAATPYQSRGINDLENALMLETAATALEELIRLLRIDEPLWMKTLNDGRYVLHRDSYGKIFPRPNHFKSSSARTESSKASGVVIMSAIQLVDFFLDADKWTDLFPTIIINAETFHIIDPGMPGNRSGALQLMYQQMHIFSPLVSPRDFYFLRHCQQIELGVWVIVDVSYEILKDCVTSARCWRLPSGCLIQEMPNGCSKITWVEHVEVDDKAQTHRLYRDLVFNTMAYGADRWLFTLQRMCERLAYTFRDCAPSHELGGVLTSPEGRRSVMKLSYRMVKNFCGILRMSGKLDFPQLSEVNNSGVRVSVRISSELGQPSGTVVSAATSLWLPLPPETIFNFFRDEKARVQWDVLSYGNPVHEIAHILTGVHPGNSISIIQPFIPTENNMLILQESCIDSLGSLVIYAPIDVPAMNIATSGQDPSEIPILPSGFVITGDGRTHSGTEASTSATSGRPSGSLLTIAFQILVSSVSSSKQLNVESVATVNTLISATVQRIKAALNCSGLD